MRGNVLLIAAAGTAAMVGGAGLSVDAVQWYLWKRQLQQAVDSGSSAGALSLAQGHGYQTEATRELGRNADSTLSVSIQSITNPPSSGAYTGDTNAVEVIATTSQSLPFSSIFVSTAPTIRARSVATTVSDGEYCVIALADSGIGVNIAGSSNANLGCGVAADSQIQAAIDFDGSSYMNAPTFHAVGGIEASSSNIPSTADLQPYGMPVGDPLAARGLTVPTSPASCTASNLTISPSQNVTLSPGRYCNNLTLKGTVTLSPGVYIIDKGALTIESHAHVTGDGVTFVLTGTDVGNVAYASIAGGADLNLRAPTAVEDSYWKNVLFFQDPIGSTHESYFAGDSNLDLEGIIYMPDGNVRFTGSSGQHANCLLLVAYRVTFAGDTSLDNNCSSDYDDLNLSARIVRVVE